MSTLRRYRLPLIEAFRKQVRFAASGVVRKQALAAETLVCELEEDRVYPSEWVVWRITGFRPEDEALSDQLLHGDDLRRDLTVFVQDLARDTEFAATDRAGGALSTAEAAQRVGVSVRTLQRWRDRGLPLIPIRFADGSRRRGCFLNALETFVLREAALVERASKFGSLETVIRPPSVLCRPGVDAARRFVLRAHDWRIAESTVAARLRRGLSTVRRLLREARTERLRTIEPWNVELATASLPSANEVFAVAGQFDDVIASVTKCRGMARLKCLRAIERVDDPEHAINRIAALHFLHKRAWDALASHDGALTTRALDSIERDVMWSSLLLQRAAIGVGGESLRRLEQSLGRRLSSLDENAIDCAIAFVLHAAAEAIQGFDPARKDALEALPRSVGFAVARGVAQQEISLASTGSIKVTQAVYAPTDALYRPQQWWHKAGETMTDAAQRQLLELRHGVGAPWRPMTLIEMARKLGVPPSHLRVPLEDAERMLRRHAIAFQDQK